MDRITDYWWLPFCAGVLSMIVGVVAVFYPGPTLLVVGMLIGIYFALWGLLAIVRGIGGDGRGAGGRILLAILGLLAILVGLVLMVRPDQSVKTIAIVLGFWWVLSGVTRIALGIAFSEGRGVNVASGIVGLIAGIVILAQPKIGLGTLVIVSGIGLIVTGGLEAMAGWRLRGETTPSTEVLV